MVTIGGLAFELRALSYEKRRFEARAYARCTANKDAVCSADGGACSIWGSETDPDRRCSSGGCDAAKRKLAGVPSGMHAVLYWGIRHQPVGCAAFAAWARAFEETGTRAGGSRGAPGARVGCAFGGALSRELCNWDP